eukprot:512656-Amorphochlora_amoeboformis.AAC.2
MPLAPSDLNYPDTSTGDDDDEESNSLLKADSVNDENVVANCDGKTIFPSVLGGKFPISKGRGSSSDELNPSDGSKAKLDIHTCCAFGVWMPMDDHPHVKRYDRR